MPFPQTVDQIVDGTTFYHASHVLGPQRITVGPAWYNVKSDQYGAVGDGVTNDAPAINAAISAAAAAGGGIVFLPPGTYLVSSTISISGDQVELWGAGWNTVIKAASGLNADVISTPTTTGSVRQNCVIRNCKIDGQRASQTAGAAIHLYGTRYCLVERVWIVNAFNYCVSLDGDGTGFGFNNTVAWCVMDLSNGCVTEQFNEANVLFGNQFKYSDTNQMVALNSGYNFVTDNVFGSGGNYPGPALQLGNSGPSKIVSNRFDQVRNEAIKTNSGGQIIIGNAIGSPGKATAVPGIHIGANGHNVVIGNKVFNITGATFSYAISEDGGADNNTIIGNDVIAGATGTINAVGAHTVCRDNNGFNPQGVAAITVGASPFTYTNNDAVEEMVYITGGTVSAIAKNAVTIFAASPAGVLLTPGESLTVTYSVAPTMNKDRK